MTEEERDKYDELLRIDQAFGLVWENMAGKAPLFRFTFTIIFILMGAGWAIHQFRKYEINYFHIF